MEDAAHIFAEDRRAEQLAPPKNRATTTAIDQPAGAEASMMNCTIKAAAATSASASAIKPAAPATRKGASPKPTRPLTARPINFRASYFGLPRARERDRPERRPGSSRPRRKPSDEPLSLRHRVDQIRHPPRHDAKIAGVDRHVDCRNAIE